MRRPTEQLSPAQLARKSVHRLPSQQGLHRSPSQQGLHSAPSGLDNISRKAPEDRTGDDSEASVVRSALAAVAVLASAELLRNPAHLKFACGEGLDSFLP